MRQSFTILLLGDFHFGENYPRGAKVLDRRGYRYPTKHLVPFCEKADQVILNLETPLVDPRDSVSPFEGNKGYLHWADANRSGGALAALGVDAVSLANNHTLDQGVSGLETTLNTLEKLDIAYFGAGMSLPDAAAPYSIELPRDMGGGAIDFYGSFDYRLSYEEKYAYYAQDERAGANPLSRRSVSDLAPRTTGPMRYNVAFPHFGANYRWVSTKQRRQAEILTSVGHDLVIGHGSHCLQDFEVLNGVPVFWSLGNGMFLSPGRFKKFIKDYDILPYGAWAFLEVEIVYGSRNLWFKIYPVFADNRVTNFQPRLLGEKEFDDLTRRFTDAAEGMTSSGFPVSPGWDSLGPHFRINLGPWPDNTLFLDSATLDDS